MARRPRAVRLGVPAFIVAVLALVALWRVGVPPPGPSSAPREVLGPLTQLAEVLADNAIGRQASLEDVIIGEVPSTRTLWIGSSGNRVFVVLDPDVKNVSGTALQPGASVTVLGLVRTAPTEDTAMRQWAIDAATAAALRERGTYLHVTEVRAGK